jgi:hypothetical protein
MIWLLLALSCAGDLHTVPGTTARVGDYKPEGRADLELEIFSERKTCERLLAETGTPAQELEQCLPWIDRGSGEVRLGFAFRLDGNNYPLPLSLEHLAVSHSGSEVGDARRGERIEIIAHQPVQVDQLFVLMIDASASMNSVDGSDSVNRMQKVRKALLMPSVGTAFFPEDGNNRVVIFTFTDGAPRPLGGSVKMLDSAEEYRKLIRSSLKPSSGYTHLYDAVRYGTIDLLKDKKVKEWLELREAAPTVVVLTDGFNNERPSDVCGDNAPRLQSLLEDIYAARFDEGIDIRVRPSIYTVGLGKPLRKKFSLPRGNRTRVLSSRLCGSAYGDRRIDGDIERLGIDNASLSWISDIGGGMSFVRRKSSGLGDAFRATAAVRHKWFEIRYKIDPMRLRREFQTRLTLKTFAVSDSSIMLYPNGWLDAPPGELQANGWSKARPYTYVMSVLMPVMGAVVFLLIFGAAFFNVKRVLSGRLRRP